MIYLRDSRRPGHDAKLSRTFFLSRFTMRLFYFLYVIGVNIGDRIEYYFIAIKRFLLNFSSRKKALLKSCNNFYNNLTPSRLDVFIALIIYCGTLFTTIYIQVRIINQLIFSFFQTPLIVLLLIPYLQSVCIFSYIFIRFQSIQLPKLITRRMFLSQNS